MQKITDTVTHLYLPIEGSMMLPPETVTLFIIYNKGLSLDARYIHCEKRSRNKCLPKGREGERERESDVLSERISYIRTICIRKTERSHMDRR